MNDSDKVVVSGAFAEGHANTVKEEVLCLAEGTYTLRLLDDSDDGGAVATGVDANGKLVFSVGPYFSDQVVILTNGNSEVVLGKAEGGSYTSEVEITFCFGCGEVKAHFNLSAEGTVSGVALTWEEKVDNEEGFRVEKSLDQEKWEVNSYSWC